MEQKRQPIGYYLRLADNYLTKGIDDIQIQYDLNRTEWQILNSIQENQNKPKQEIFEIMKPFADRSAVKAVLSLFISKNLIKTNNEMLSLTMAGEQLHQECFNTQQEFRKKAVAGISENDYSTTISTLQKMIDNIK